MKTTAAEAAREIRTRLKAAGVPARAVSVRASSYSMGSTISVKILDIAIDFATVKAAANPEEHVRRDEYGEILGGGNRFVDLSYCDDVLAAVAASLVADANGDRTWRGYRIFPSEDGHSADCVDVAPVAGGRLLGQSWGLRGAVDLIAREGAARAEEAFAEAGVIAADPEICN